MKSSQNISWIYQTLLKMQWTDWILCWLSFLKELFHIIKAKSPLRLKEFVWQMHEWKISMMISEAPAN